MAARRAAPAPRPAAHCSRTPSGADLCAMRRPNPQWAAGRSLRGQRGRVHDAVIVRRTRGRVEVCRWSATGSRQQARCVPRPRPAAGSRPGRRGRPRPCAPALRQVNVTVHRDLRHVNVTVHRDIYTRKKGPESLRDLDFKISEILPKRVGVGGNVYNYIQAPQTVVFESKHTPKNGARVNRFWITSFQKWCSDHPNPPFNFATNVYL